jgi:hypothetical protein
MVIYIRIYMIIRRARTDISHVPSLSSTTAASNNNTVRISRKPWLSIYRALLMLHTCAAILAVDFPVFPRRFAKVETFGVSLVSVNKQASKKIVQ